jgi:hypothetical protein
MRREYVKKIHLANISHNRNKFFLPSIGLEPFCQQHNTTFLTGEKDKVTCNRCIHLMKQMEKNLSNWYELVVLSWNKETGDKILPIGYQLPKRRRKKD